MIQYLLNMTAVWLLSLVIFDLLLRRETFHNYNRLYLTVSLIMGILLPLWSWSPDSVIYATDISERVAEETALLKTNIVDTTSSTLISFEQWVWIIYLCGVFVSTMFLTKEFFAILSLYKTGRKSKEDKWTIIETGKDIAPFSTLNMIFLSSKEKYTNDELSMILAHESQHVRLLHFADLLLVRLCNIVFWFHPLVYLFEKRLLLVHEYQADSAVKNYPQEYGRFLVEQAILKAAPSLSYSFAYQPIKKRIVMMTKTTKTLAKGKQLILLPLVFLCTLCFTENAFSFGDEAQRDGNVVTYRGNTIEFSPDGAADTVMVEDPSTGDIRMVVTRREGGPIKFNGEQVHTENTMRTPGKFGGDVSTKSNFTSQSLKMYLLTNMDKEIKKN